MTAQLAIQTALDAGLSLSLRGGNIKIRAARPAPDEILNELIRFKPEVIDYLKRNQLRQCWTVELPNGKRFYQIRPQGMTKDAALQAALKRWPGATVN